MSAELEKQLVEFLLTKRDYTEHFARHLINILKSHSGKYVKKDIDCSGADIGYFYYCVTDNFIVFAYNSGTCLFDIRILHKYKTLIIGIFYDIVDLDFYVSDIDRANALRREFVNGGKFCIFGKEFKYWGDKIDYHNMSIDWLFATNSVKSARN